MEEVKPLPPEKISEFYARAQRECFPGEPLWCSIQRRVAADFIIAFGSQKKAAEVLGVSRGIIHRQVQASIARKVNARLGRTDLNRTGRGRFPRAVADGAA